MKHRYDIDGLRAIAVLPILLFHAGVSGLSGGFVGVDIFFVISGFLITSIIMREMEDGHFSIAGFYHRRVVRIFPALIMLLVVVLLLGTHLLLANELRETSRSAAAAMGFVSNIYFWSNTDYFAGAAETKPLLHTWSLGVEEQFYMFYPLLLILIRRFIPRHIGPAIFALTLLSFFASLVLTLRSPSTAFYLLPTRAWELGAGALVALGMMPKLTSPPARNAAALAGVLLLLAAIVTIRATDPFPAPWAVLPCAGAVLMIAYGQSAVTAPFLAWQPMRWIGAISYSLYLWHWPIITYYRLQFGTTLTPRATALLVGLSFLAATISYFLVEQPALRRYRRAAPGPVLAVGSAALAGTVVASMLISMQSDAIVRHPAQVKKIATYADYRKFSQYQYQFRRGTCFIGEGQRFDEERCLRTMAGRANVVVLGDSHAAQYWRALSLRFPAVNVMQATASGCRPTIALRGEKRCTTLVDRVLNHLTTRPSFTGIVLAGRWKASDVRDLIDTVEKLRARGLTVTVVGPGNEYDGEMPQLLARAILRDDLDRLERFRLQDREDLDRTMHPLIVRAGAQYLSAFDAECPNRKCALFDNEGGPLHFDYGHFTLAGSRAVIANLNSISQPRPSPGGL